MFRHRGLVELLENVRQGDVLEELQQDSGGWLEQLPTRLREMIPRENPRQNLFMVPMFLDATFRMCPFLVSLHTCLRISCLFYHDFMTFQPFQPQNILVESRYQSKAVGVSAESTYPQLAKHTMEFESPHRDLMTGEPGFLWSEWDSSPRNCWWTFAT